MRWFRSNIGLGSRLALFALAIQIVLTFGHVHGLTPAAAEMALSALAPHSGTSAPDPAGKSKGSADFDCPICALIQMASTSAPSVAPALPVPTNFIVVRLETPVQVEWAASPYFPFQARGPPTI